MKQIHAKSTLRLIAATLITGAIIGLSSVAMHAPAQNQSALGLKSIQTDKTTLFYADVRPNDIWFVEEVLPGTSESKTATENLRVVAATL